MEDLCDCKETQILVNVWLLLQVISVLWAPV